MKLKFAADSNWPEAGFPYAYRKQTLANQAVTANVSILAAPRPHAPGQEESLADGCFQASEFKQDRETIDSKLDMAGKWVMVVAIVAVGTFLASSIVRRHGHAAYPGKMDCRQGCDFVAGWWPFPLLG